MKTKTIEVGAVARKANRDGFWGVKIDGTDTWLNFQKQPKFGRGAKVKVQYDPSDREVEKFKVLEEGNTGGGGRGGRRGGGGGRGSYNDPEREKKIVMQHSQEMAVSAAELILAHDGEKLGAKTKPAERKAAILSLIDEMTARFFSDVFEQNSLKAAKEVEDDLDDDDDDDDDFDDDDLGGDSDEDDDVWED